MSFRILVAVDGSETSRQAARWVARRENRSDSAITLWHALEPVPVAPFVWDPGAAGVQVWSEIEKASTEALKIRDEERKAADELFESIIADMAKEGVPRSRVKSTLQARVLGHDVASLIIQAVQDGRFDEVVVGRRGLGRFREWLLGSVSNRLVHHLKGGAVTIVG